MPTQIVKTGCAAVFTREFPFNIKALSLEECETCYVHVIDKTIKHRLFYIDLTANQETLLNLTEKQLIVYNHVITQYSKGKFAHEKKFIVINADLSAEKILQIVSITGVNYFPTTWNLLSWLDARRSGKFLSAEQEMITSWYERKMLLKSPQNGFFNQAARKCLVHGFQIFTVLDERSEAKILFERSMELIENTVNKRQSFGLLSVLVMNEAIKRTIHHYNLLWQKAVELCVKNNVRDLLIPVLDAIYEEFVKEREKDFYNNRFQDFCEDIVTRLACDDNAIIVYEPILVHIQQLDLYASHLPEKLQEYSRIAVINMEKSVLHFIVATLGKISLLQLNDAVLHFSHECNRVFCLYAEQVSSSAYPLEVNADFLYQRFINFFKDLDTQYESYEMHNQSVSGPLEMIGSLDEERSLASCVDQESIIETYSARSV